MRHIFFKTFLPVLLALLVSACGGLRYTKCAPEAQDFHPEKIGILSIKTGPYKEAEPLAKKIVAESVSNTDRYAAVLTPDAIAEKMAADGVLKEAVTEYLMKLEKVSFSDPDLSRRIGEAVDIDAFLIVRVNFWNYTVAGNEEVAKVGFGMNLVEAATGKILWTCEHYEAEDYLIKKPQLASVAKDVAEKMIRDMPH